MDGRLRKLEPFLETVFEDFYARLLSDRHFSVFFRDQDHVRSLIARQREHLRGALYESDAGLFRRYVALGRMHHDIFVPYTDFEVGIDFLTDRFFQLVANQPEIGCDPDLLFRFFQRVKNYTAKGYLERTLERDRINLSVFIEHVRASRGMGSEVVEANLHWLVRVLEATTSEREERLPPLIAAESPIFQWLNSAEAEHFLSDESDRHHLIDLYRRVHTDASNLFYFIERQNYPQVLLLYCNLNRLMLIANNMVTVLHHNMRVTELVRDELTGLYNRKTMDRTLEEQIALARRSRRPLSVVMTDLDDFKAINDHHGHRVGDRVLREVAELVQRYIRSSDVAFRYGGEEFLLLLNDTDPQGAHLLAENIRRAVESTRIHSDGRELGLTLSLGVAGFDPGSADESTALIERADRALYRAKNSGKNRVEYQPHPPRGSETLHHPG